jgi:hypothetical protein
MVAEPPPQRLSLLTETETDAIVRADAPTFCGSDLPMLKGDLPEVEAGPPVGAALGRGEPRVSLLSLVGHGSCQGNHLSPPGPSRPSRAGSTSGQPDPHEHDRTFGKRLADGVVNQLLLPEMQSFFLDVGVVPTNYISLPVVDDCPVSTHARTQTRDHRKDGSHCSYDHQDDADRVNVEPMLVGIYRQGEIQNGSNSEDDDACS